MRFGPKFGIRQKMIDLTYFTTTFQLQFIDFLLKYAILGLIWALKREFENRSESIS